MSQKLKNFADKEIKIYLCRYYTMFICIYYWHCNNRDFIENWLSNSL